MKTFTPARRHVVAVLVALTAALFARSWLQLYLRDSGFDRLYAADLSYLAAWPILLLLLLPVLRESRDGLRRLFDTSNLNVQLVLGAIAVGVLIRLAWWCQLVAGISFGIYSNDNPAAIVGPQFGFQCAQWLVVTLGFLVMAVLVPVTEEVINRGFVQSALNRYGPLAAIAGSSVVFTVFHPPGGWVFVFVAGLILGTQFWVTRSLWASLFTHATINGLIQLDWRCLRGHWNPPSNELPLTVPGTVAVLLFAACAVTVCVILLKTHRGSNPPR